MLDDENEDLLDVDLSYRNDVKELADGLPNPLVTEMPGFDFQGHRVTLTEQFGFVITGPYFELPKVVASAFLAKAVIDQECAKVERAKGEARKVHLTALTHEGERFTIRGIHRALGSLLGLPKDLFHYWRPGDYRQEKLIYPDVPWIGQALTMKHALMKRVWEVDEATQPFGLSIDRTHTAQGWANEGYTSRGHIDLRNYSRVCDNLENELEEKRAAAEEKADEIGNRFAA